MPVYCQRSSAGSPCGESRNECPHGYTDCESRSGIGEKGRQRKEWPEKEQGKYVYYVKGKKVKNTWKTVGNTKCYLDKTGKALTGVRIINEKFYWLGKNARRDAKKTRQLQAAAVYEKDFSALKKLIGNPLKSEYMGSCYGAGEDGRGSAPGAGGSQPPGV